MMRSCNLPRRTSNALFVALACAAFGCSSQPGGSGGLPAIDEPVDSPECTSTPKCDGDEVDDQGNPTTCVQTVDADLVDENGVPVAGFHAQICSAKVCTGAKSDAQGHLHFVLCKNMVAPALDIPGHAKFVTYAVPIQRAVASLGPLTLVALASGALQMSGAAADKTYASGGAVLVVPAGADVDVDPIDNPEAEDQMFRAARLDPDAAPGVAEASPGLTLLYGLAPTGTKLSKAASLTIPNANDWPAGCDVEFWVQGSSTQKVPGAAWFPVGAGKVSEDGKTVSTNDAITYINLIGVKRK
jgi:hypothetical protein